MKRTPLKRKPTDCPRCSPRWTICRCSTFRGSELARNKPLPARNWKRQAKRKEEDRVYGSYHKWIGTLDCELRGHPEHWCQPGTVKGHHDIPVGRGGEDYANEIPLCRIAHVRSPKAIHNMSRSRWQAFWKVDIDARKAEYARQWKEGEGGENG